MFADVKRQWSEAVRAYPYEQIHVYTYALQNRLVLPSTHACLMCVYIRTYVNAYMHTNTCIYAYITLGLSIHTSHTLPSRLLYTSWNQCPYHL